MSSFVTAHQHRCDGVEKDETVNKSTGVTVWRKMKQLTRAIKSLHLHLHFLSSNM